MSKSVIRQYLVAQGYDLPSESWYSHVELFRLWYEGFVPEFHKYKVYNGTRNVPVERSRLGMAKTVCEDHANLLLNERVTITTGDSTDEWLADILTANNFWVRGNNLVELAFALGTGAFVEYKGDENVPVIDYIRADMMYPLSWDNGVITECAFGSIKYEGRKKVCYVQLHILDGGQTYKIRNIYLDARHGGELPLPDGLLPEIDTGCHKPLFQVIRPNIVNNLELDCPMGISVYGNALDQLKGCDLVWDSYINEFVLGRKRIIAPMSMSKIMMSDSGVVQPVFDPNDTVFYAYQTDDTNTGQKIEEIDLTLRSAEHETGIQRALDMLSKKCGLGNGRYRFDSGTVKTATEVISEKSEMYQNLKKNELILSDALAEMVKALAFLSGHGEPEVIVGFDDSIIEDSQARMTDNIALVGAGLKSKFKAIMEVQKCDEAEAHAEMQRIDEENGISDIDLDAFGSASVSGDG